MSLHSRRIKSSGTRELYRRLGILYYLQGVPRASYVPSLFFVYTANSRSGTYDGSCVSPVSFEA